jgi:hypothetical protein
MAITQARMTALIAEGQAHRAEIQRIRNAVARIVEDRQLDATTMRGMLTALVLNAALPDNAALLLEDYHFRKFGRENERQRLRKTRERRASGVPERKSPAGPALDPAAYAAAQRSQADELNAMFSLGSGDLAAVHVPTTKPPKPPAEPLDLSDNRTPAERERDRRYGADKLLEDLEAAEQAAIAAGAPECPQCFRHACMCGAQPGAQPRTQPC